MQNAQSTADITISYVNHREGNRPPTIKGDDGNYYTISDTALPLMEQAHQTSGQISFYTNKSGYRQATAWNGQPLPKDARKSASTAATAPVTNVVPMPAPAPAALKKRQDVPPGIAGIIKSCIETGLTREEAAGWVALGLEGKAALKQTMPPPTPQHLDAPDNDLNDAIPF
jgi:hypothetical protein